jgi:hypothetical protein
MSPLRLIVALGPAIALLGCQQPDSARLAAAVEAFSKAADECLLDIRDRSMKYDRSSNCSSLGTLSRLYIDAGGGSSETPLQYEIVFERARATAWIARAISETGDSSLRIW